jgi:hypothetical protein
MQGHSPLTPLATLYPPSLSVTYIANQAHADYLARKLQNLTRQHWNNAGY